MTKNNTNKKKFYTSEDVTNGDAVKCEHCGGFMPMIQWSHLKYKCKSNITVKEYKELYPNAKVVAENVLKQSVNTLENMIRIYGEEEGQKRWDSYRNKQAVTNTFEYKKEKYGWTEEDFDKYNQSRAVTKENLINRHGDEKGLEIWNNYIEQQRYTCSKDYFIEEYGEDKGLNKYHAWNDKRLTTSNLELEINEFLEMLFGKLDKQIEIADNNKQTHYYFDCGSIEKKKIIEIHGDLFHANPKKFKKDDMISIKKMKAEEIWKKDQHKQNLAKQQGYDVFVIWEMDWHSNKEEVLEQVTNWWKQ
jgi:hypothetical protein